MAIAGTKHTILTDKNEIVHRKRASKPINPSYQNPLSRRGETPRVADSRFIITQTSEGNPERNERSTPILEENVLDTTLGQD